MIFKKNMVLLDTYALIVVSLNYIICWDLFFQIYIRYTSIEILYFQFCVLLFLKRDSEIVEPSCPLSLDPSMFPGLLCLKIWLLCVASDQFFLLNPGHFTQQ